VLAGEVLAGHIESSLNDLIDVKTQELALASTAPEVAIMTPEATGDDATSPSASGAFKL
jgi:hypothetical protein